MYRENRCFCKGFPYNLYESHGKWILSNYEGILSLMIGFKMAKNTTETDFLKDANVTPPSCDSLLTFSLCCFGHNEYIFRRQFSWLIGFGFAIPGHESIIWSLFCSAVQLISYFFLFLETFYILGALDNSLWIGTREGQSEVDNRKKISS